MQTLLGIWVGQLGSFALNRLFNCQVLDVYPFYFLFGHIHFLGAVKLLLEPLVVLWNNLADFGVIFQKSNHLIIVFFLNVEMFECWLGSLREKCLENLAWNYELLGVRLNVIRFQRFDAFLKERDLTILEISLRVVLNQIAQL